MNKEIYSKSIPLSIDFLSQSLMWVIELVIVGRLSINAVAAVGFASQIFMFILIFVNIAVMGTIVILNREIGAGNADEASYVFSQSIAVILLSCIVVVPLFYFIVKFVISFGIKDSVTARLAFDYAKPLLLFLPLLIMNYLIMGLLRGTGNNIITMITNIIINALNILFAVVLVYGWAGIPAYGVAGAAWAVVIAQISGFIIILFSLLKHKNNVKIKFRKGKNLDFLIIKRILHLGIPISLEQAYYLIGQLVLSMIVGRFSSILLAIHQILLRLQMFISMIFQAFGWTAGINLSRHLAGKKIRHGFSILMRTQKGNILIALIIAGAVLILNKNILYLFSPGSEKLNISLSIFVVFSILQVIKAANIVFSGALRGVGDVRFLMHWMLFGAIFLEITFGLGLAYHLNLFLVGIWLAMAIDESVRFIAYWHRLKSLRWIRQQV